MIEQMRSAIRQAIAAAKRSEEFAALAGDPIGDDGGYQVVEHELERALIEVRELREHAHAWDGEGYCMVCGADGAA